MRLIAVVLVCLTLCSQSFAEDTIWLSAAGHVQAEIASQGEIVDFNRVRLLLRFSNGRESDYPTERVQRYQTPLTEEHEEANRLLAAKQYTAAIEKYTQAERGTEKRAWVRREILAQRARCLNFRNHSFQAAGDFLAIYASDPKHRHWDCIPLQWRTQEVNVLWQRQFSNWINDDKNEAKQLIAASHLFGIAQQRQHVKLVLQKLSRSDQNEIAWYAQTQLWRFDLTTAPESQIRQWEALTEKQPSCCQAGAWLLIGQAWSLQRNHSSAALAWLRVPVVFPENRDLAANCLLNAAQASESLGRLDSARTLYEEVARDYSDFQVLATAAQRRLAELR